MNEQTRTATTVLHIVKLCSEIIEEIHAYDVEAECRHDQMAFIDVENLKDAYNNAEQTLDDLANVLCNLVRLGRVDWVEAMRESEMDKNTLFCPWMVYEIYQRQTSGPKWLH